MKNKRYKVYLASGIRLWTMYFKDEYSPFFNKKVDLFQPALIDNQYDRNHRLIPIRIATKDLGEINQCDAVLAYMKMYDTQGNGPAGTDSTWECGYAIGKEKPTIMLVENLEHLDYYTAQWMVTFSIGAILTTDKEVVKAAKNSDKFTHTTILYCSSKNQFEDKIIEYLDNFYRSVYVRSGKINYRVDEELRHYAETATLKSLLSVDKTTPRGEKYFAKLQPTFEEVYGSKNNFSETNTHKKICALELARAKTIKTILTTGGQDIVPFLHYYIEQCIAHLESGATKDDVVAALRYWISIPAEKIRGRQQGKKKTRPTIFYELYDLVSHHITASERYFGTDFAYKLGAIIEIYNWVNTYALDDVFDNSDTRQGHATLHVRCQSRKNACLIGAIGHCLSLLMLKKLTGRNEEIGNKLLLTLNDAQYLMYLGQPIDISLSMKSRRDIKRFLSTHSLERALELYFERIYGICGAFYEEIGRLSVQSTNVGAQFYDQKKAEEIVIYIAKLFGLVQMIRNDLGDLLSSEQMPALSKGMKSTAHNDILEGKLTLPVLYVLLCETIPDRDKKALIKFLSKKSLTAKEHLEINRIIWENGAVEYCMQYVELFVRRVKHDYAAYINETPTRLKWIINMMDIAPLIDMPFRKLAYDSGWRKREPLLLDEKLIKKIDMIVDRKQYLNKYD